MPLLTTGAGVYPAVGGGGGTVAFDAVTFSNPGANPWSWTHTPVGTPTAVAVLIGPYATAPTAVTYGGVAMTKATDNTTPGNGAYSSLWGLANPPSGAQTVAVTLTNNALGPFSAGASVTVTGSDTTTCFRASSPANNSTPGGTSLSTSCTTNQTGDLIIDIICQNATSPTLSTTGANTKLGSQQNNGGQHIALSTAPGTGSTVAMSWSSTVSNGMSACSAAFKHS